MRELAGKRAFLTGAASGIGRSLAIALAREKVNLFLVDVDAPGLERVCAEVRAPGIEVVGRVCDLADPEALKRTVAEAISEGAPIDLLINNAGIGHHGPTDAMTDAQWDRLLAVNLLAPIRITGQMLPLLLARPDAHIVNMCSIMGIVARGRVTAYQVSKFGLVGFTESLRAEYGRKGLGVTAICPGPAQTGIYASAALSAGDRKTRTPPSWALASPETIAARTLNGIRKNKRMVLVTPMAYGLYYMKRIAPGLIDFMNTFSRARLRQRLGLPPRRKSKGGAAGRGRRES